jgi:hypothetical protein
MSDTNQQQDKIVFNTGAKEWKPKEKKIEGDDKLQETEIKASITVDNNEKQPNLFNLDAQEFKPKGLQVQSLEDELEEDEDDDEDQAIEEIIQQEQNLIIDDEEESDEEKWFPKYKDCTCCKGFIYKCDGDVCKSLGACFCKAQEDYDPEL